MTKIKQVLVGRYYDKVKLQRVLEGLFPEENGVFELRMTNDNWVFYATRDVTMDELKSARLPSTAPK
ncbi:hypothetical protein NXS19_014204 [Fusarium pseudograminearum]|uniref:Uncharacterized protein n=1 Tax=Fusarium pseudograminearum (strain CS3096) TaxID=1028729 RepID=K3ULQ0_FUSPC|nr:hypothetical protein FPSE_06819 [Fusarium pseudograminearum CS3096]EKJ73031.1 hypothetical protein FPSE_06819 [Fusarium pseudograminearum CS3096]UZP46392.1 hypothetical protein NXS19_014204 [Fusarium pseudograminearum]